MGRFRFFQAWPTVAFLTILALGFAPLAVPGTANASPAAIKSSQFGDLQQAIAVQSAQAYIDGAGLHELGEDLAKASQVDPGTIGVVRNVRTVAGIVAWPDEMAGPQQALVAALSTLETALIGNQLPEAQAAAETVHETAHDLSQAAFAWMQEQSGLNQVDVFTTGDEVDHLLGAIGVQSAQAYIDGAGLHELGEELAQASQVDPGAIGTVRNVLTVANLVPWPAELAADEQEFVAALTPLETALIGNQLAEAQQAAETVHEAEHDLSQATYAWLGGITHDQAAILAMMASDKLVEATIVTGVQSAQAYIDGAGLHELGEALAQTSQVDPGTIGTVRNVRTVAGLVLWPAELALPQQALVAALSSLETALIGNQVPEAQQAAETVHEAAHDLSQATYAWLGTRVTT